MNKIISLFFLLFIGNSSFADTFIVTTNADNGIGSLRDAIIKANANGSSVTDNIHFNITDNSITGRTIILLSAYPNLTSKIIIDGTTQPGAFIGVSHAKIRITNPTGVGVEGVFTIINSNNVEIYGFHFDKLNIVGGTYMSRTAILLNTTQQITVGGAGRGNYFTNIGYAVGNATSNIYSGIIDGLSFKGNIVNLSEDGNSILTGSDAIAIWLFNVKDLEIGGAQPGEGNYMSTIDDIMVYTFINNLHRHINMGYAKIINNKMGCNFSETAPLTCGKIYLQNYRDYGYTEVQNITVKGNSFNAQAYAFSNHIKSFLEIEGKKGFIDIKANKIGILGNPASNFYSIIGAGISIANCEEGIIGGDNVADTNFIAGCSGAGIALYNNQNIRITKNSIFCNNKGIGVGSTQVTIPKTKIFVINSNLVQGTSLPNSTIEVFLTQVCAGCNNGKTYLGSCIADASGNWTFNSPVMLDGAITATGTSTTGATGEFAKPEFSRANLVFQAPTCNLNNGFINGMEFISGTKYYWERNINGYVDTIYALNLDNIGPGYYKFIVEQGAFCSVNYSIALYDRSPLLHLLGLNITNPNCGLNNGKINNLYASGSYNKIMWLDAFNNVVGSTFDISNLGAGKYKLIVQDTIYGCGDTSDFYTLTNQGGPSLNTNNVIVNATSCGSKTGSIMGITANNAIGNPSIRWIDSLGNIVGNDLNLTNVFPGKYRLKYKDGSGCDTITTSYFIVSDNGSINIDSTNKIITASKCSGNTGSITQIQITGADNIIWKNTATNATVGNAADVNYLAPGNYQFSASNTIGCSKTSTVFIVPKTDFIPISATSFTVINDRCLQNIGSININNFNNDSALFSFKWLDSITGNFVSNGIRLSNLATGNYLLFATDSNGCEQKIFSKQINNSSPVFDYRSEQVINSSCDLPNGSIYSIKINGLTGPTIYTWFDENNNPVGTNPNLNNVSIGTYRLQVDDAGICQIQSKNYSITNSNNRLAAPLYDDLLIEKNSSGLFSVKNYAAANYYLYADAAGTQLIQQNTTGNFNIININTDSSFYVNKKNGSCFSDMQILKVKVITALTFTIPTAFTPNGDGLNDVLSVRGTGISELNYFRIFNKLGELIFETRRLNDNWNGTYKNVLQNTGTFVWVAEGKSQRGEIVAGKGSFILIR